MNVEIKCTYLNVRLSLWVFCEIGRISRPLYQGRNEVGGIRDQRGGIGDQKGGI